MNQLVNDLNGAPKSRYSAGQLLRCARSTSTSSDGLEDRAGKLVSTGAFRILVIDDSPTVVHAVKRAFSATACQVETVEHYLEIPRYLRMTPPDLVVLDLKMPGLSGERVAEFIRRDQQRDTPILIYSSLPDDALRAAASRIRAVGWMSKQAPVRRLVELVEAALT